MGVVTTADECRGRAATKLSEGISELSRVVIDRCEGSDDYLDHYQEKLRMALSELIRIRDLLGPNTRIGYPHRS